nr:peptidyl-prolyl cis-trans isomerase PASTICCINO1 [Tanacetum cinerariifolium]GEZ76577.1 peptidyl-prolyl cis-trans isomerase PASTICCINO1 [Tanacetum cinerariifolium]
IKKMVPGGLMKAVIRPGGGDLMPSDGDQAKYDIEINKVGKISKVYIALASGIMNDDEVNGAGNMMVTENVQWEEK